MMARLDGKRALIVGLGNPHAETCRAALAARAISVTVVDPSVEPTIDAAADVLVICAPAFTHRMLARETIAAAVAPAEAWTAHFAASLKRERREGVIVHVTGLAGLGGWPRWQAAGAAYAAIHNIVHSTAVDLAPHNIRVNALVPGVDDALATQLAAATGRSLDDIRARIPAARFMQPAALANALLYLVHPASSYVTGETLTVDGGWDIWGRLAVLAS